MIFEKTAWVKNIVQAQTTKLTKPCCVRGQMRPQDRRNCKIKQLNNNYEQNYLFSIACIKASKNDQRQKNDPK